MCVIVARVRAVLNKCIQHKNTDYIKVQIKLKIFFHVYFLDHVASVSLQANDETVDGEQENQQVRNSVIAKNTFIRNLYLFECACVKINCFFVCLFFTRDVRSL